MTEPDFTKLLLRAAFCVMACDGHIDNREIEELQLINKNTRYFRGLDLDAELQVMIRDAREHGRRFVLGLFDMIERMEMSIVQELLLLEICMRIVNADEKLDDNEVRFLRHLRSRLSVFDQIVVQRFGAVDYLVQGSGVDLDLEKQTALDEKIWKLPPEAELQLVHIEPSN